MDERGQITFYRSYYEAVSSLPKKDRLPVYEAIISYGLDGKEPNLSGVQLAVFLLVKPTLDTARRKSKGGKSYKPSEQDKSKTTVRHEEDLSKEKEEEKDKEVEVENECYIYAPTPPESKLPPAISLTLNDKSQFPIPQDQVQQWQSLFPAVDVMQQLRNMKAWLDANPGKRKTKSGILRFCTSWLSREQDREGSPQPYARPQQTARTGTGGQLLDMINSGVFDE